MCVMCGGRCIICNDWSTRVFEAPPFTGVYIQMYSCDLHFDAVKDKAQTALNMRLAAPLN